MIAAGVVIAVAAFVVWLAVPHFRACETECRAACRKTAAGGARAVCERSCRARCGVTKLLEDPLGSTADRGFSRGPKPIRIGEADIAVPELNFPLVRLAKAAVQLRAPMATPVESKSDGVDLRGEYHRRGLRIEHQKETPTCMAHALTSAMEFALVPHLRSDPALARAVGVRASRVDLSRKHAHYLSLHAAGLCQRSEDRGSWVLQAASGMRTEGTFLEAHWPWRPWDPKSKRWKTCEEAMNGGKPSKKALAARHFFLDSYSYLPPFGLETAAAAREPRHLEGILAQDRPIVLAVFLITASFDRAWRNGGVVHCPKGIASQANGLHYVLLLGYDRATQRFLFANSWGTQFGSRGFGYLDYDYVRRYAVEGLTVEKVRIVAPTP